MKNTDGNVVATQVVTTGDESPGSPTAIRMDSWKDIAQYFSRNVRTVQRWETLEGMPVHRHRHETGHSVYAYKEEIDAWRSNRSREKRRSLQLSALRGTRLESLPPPEQSSLMSSLVVILEHLHQNVTSSTAGLPSKGSFRQAAATEALVVAEDSIGPRPTEHMTIGDKIRRPLFVACGRLKVDR